MGGAGAGTKTFWYRLWSGMAELDWVFECPGMEPFPLCLSLDLLAKLPADLERRAEAPPPDNEADGGRGDF